MELHAKILTNWPYYTFGKTCVKNSWIRVVIRISTKIEWFVANETSQPSKNFIRMCHQLHELTAMYAEFFPVRQCQKILQQSLYPDPHP